MPIVTDGLVLYWHVERGLTPTTWDNIAPDTLGKNNGTIVGAVREADGLLFFDAVDDVVRCGDYVGNDAEFTIDARVKYIGNNNDNASIFSFGTANAGFNWSTNNNTQTILMYDVSTKFDYITYTHTPPINNTVANVTYVVNTVAKKVSFFVNGVHVYSSTIEQSKVIWRTLSGALRLGNSEDGSGKGLRGHIWSVRVYKRELTIDEIEKNNAMGASIGLDEEPPPTGVAHPLASTVSESVGTTATLRNIKTVASVSSEATNNTTATLRNIKNIASSVSEATDTTNALQATKNIASLVSEATDTTNALQATKNIASSVSEATDTTNALQTAKTFTATNTEATGTTAVLSTGNTSVHHTTASQSSEEVTTIATASISRSLASSSSETTTAQAIPTVSRSFVSHSSEGVDTTAHVVMAVRLGSTESMETSASGSIGTSKQVAMGAHEEEATATTGAVSIWRRMSTQASESVHAEVESTVSRAMSFTASEGITTEAMVGVLVGLATTADESTESALQVSRSISFTSTSEVQTESVALLEYAGAMFMDTIAFTAVFDIAHELSGDMSVKAGLHGERRLTAPLKGEM